MKLNKDAKELIERYLYAVKKELSGKQRDDIVAEIESYLYDLLEERFPENVEVKEKELESILKEMGSPRKVAAQYSPHQYLIGPRLFPMYKIVLKIMLLVVLGALTLSMVISNVVEYSANGWKLLLEYLGTLWSGGLSVVGVITLIFAIIERTTEGKNIEEIEELKELKISELPQLPEKEKKVDRVSLFVEIVVNILGMIFLTYIQKTGGLVPVWGNASSTSQMMRLFTENFIPFIPFSLGLTGLEISRNTVLLVQGYHNALTNWWDVAQKIASCVLLGFMISALPLISLDFFRVLEETSALAQYEAQANIGLGVLMGLGIFGNIVELIKQIGREIRNPSL